MEPKGSYERGYKEGKARSVFDLIHANESIDDAVALFKRIKAWRDSPGNECFPSDLRDDIEQYLKSHKGK